MSETLEQFIARRRAELEDEEARLRNRLSEIDGEKLKLAAAEKGATHHYLGRGEAIGRKIRHIRPYSIMDDIVKVLDSNRNGLIALDILAKINENRVDPIVRTSLSPQLSRLRQRGILELIGSTWRLVDNEKAPSE